MPVLSTFAMATTMCLFSGSLILINGLLDNINEELRINISSLLFDKHRFVSPPTASNNSSRPLFGKCNERGEVKGDKKCESYDQHADMIIGKLKAALVKEVRMLGTMPVNHSVGDKIRKIPVCSSQKSRLHFSYPTSSKPLGSNLYLYSFPRQKFSFTPSRLDIPGFSNSNLHLIKYCQHRFGYLNNLDALTAMIWYVIVMITIGCVMWM